MFSLAQMSSVAGQLRSSHKQATTRNPHGDNEMRRAAGAADLAMRTCKPLKLSLKHDECDSPVRFISCPPCSAWGEFATRCRRPLLAEVSIAGSRRSRRRRLPALVGAGSFASPWAPCPTMKLIRPH